MPAAFHLGRPERGAAMTADRPRPALLSGWLALAAVTGVALADQADIAAELPPAPGCHYRAGFIQQRTLPSLPVPLASSGSLLFACDLGLVWHTATPIEETLVYTIGATHFRIDGAGRTEPLQGLVHDFMADLLLGLMAGDGSAVTRHFTLETVVPGAAWLLTPRGAATAEFINGIGLALADGAMTITVDGARGDRVSIATSAAETVADFDPEQCVNLVPAPQAACRALGSPDAVSREIRELERQ